MRFFTNNQYDGQRAKKTVEITIQIVSSFDSLYRSEINLVKIGYTVMQVQNQALHSTILCVNSDRLSLSTVEIIIIPCSMVQCLVLY